MFIFFFVPSSQKLTRTLQNGRLFYANVGEHPQKIIDIGTGTGESCTVLDGVHLANVLCHVRNLGNRW